MKRVALVALAGLALVLAPQAWAGETNTVTASFTLEDIDGPVGSRTESLAQKIVEHLSNANTDDDSQNGLDDVAQIAADGPLLSYSLVIDIDNPDTNIISPYSNIGDHDEILNTITANTDFAGITTFQQSGGNANGTSNLVLLVDGNALDKLVEELFGPDETLLETTASSFVGNVGHSGGIVEEDDDSIATAGGKKIVGGAAASDTTSSTIVNVLDVGGDAGAFIEISNPVTGILSPHSNITETDTITNSITANNLFAGVTTFQQQAGGANGQSNFVVLIYDTETVIATGQ